MRKAKRAISIAVSSLCVASMFAGTASAALNVEHSVLQVKPVSWETILDAAHTGNLEDALYPSGMQLPTKYADLLFFTGSTGKIFSPAHR